MCPRLSCHTATRSLSEARCREAKELSAAWAAPLTCWRSLHGRRWNEARKQWGDCLNRCRDVVRQGCTYFPREQASAGPVLMSTAHRRRGV